VYHVSEMDNWNLYFGIAALVLAVPLNIAANILTPKVREWWASTTKSRALRRIERIPRELRALDSYLEHPSAALGQGMKFQVYGVLLLLAGGFHLISELVLYGTFVTLGGLGSIVGVKTLNKTPKIEIGFALFMAGGILMFLALNRFRLADDRLVRGLKSSLLREYDHLTEKFSLEVPALIHKNPPHP
jgi:hypothetical protein